jgi:hypothetical protein
LGAVRTGFDLVNIREEKSKEWSMLLSELRFKFKEQEEVHYEIIIEGPTKKVG